MSRLREPILITSGKIVLVAALMAVAFPMWALTSPHPVLRGAFAVPPDMMRNDIFSTQLHLTPMIDGTLVQRLFRSLIACWKHMVVIRSRAESTCWLTELK